MKVRWIWTLGLTAVAAAAFATPADDIKAIHAAFAKAMLAGQPAAMEKLVNLHMTPDFAASGTNGIRMNRAGYIAQLKAQMAANKYAQYSYSLTPAAPMPNGIAVTATLKFAATMKDAKGKPHKQTGTMTIDEVWILVGKTPKCRRMRVQATSISTDGKPPVKSGGGPRVRLGIA